MNLMFTTSIYLTRQIPLDLTFREFFTFITVTFLMFWLGLSWQMFIV